MERPDLEALSPQVNRRQLLAIQPPRDIVEPPDRSFGPLTQSPQTMPQSRHAAQRDSAVGLACLRLAHGGNLRRPRTPRKAIAFGTLPAPLRLQGQVLSPDSLLAAVQDGHASLQAEAGLARVARVEESRPADA